MIDGADERVRILDERLRKARVRHKCAECYRIIEPGESYLTESFVDEGKFNFHKTCAHCQIARQWLSDECGGFIYGSVAEDLQEHAEDSYYGVNVKMLYVGLTRKWRRMDGRMWPVPRVPKTSFDPPRIDH